MDFSKIQLVFDGDDLNSDLSDFSSDEDQFYVEGTVRNRNRCFSGSDSDSSFDGFTEENLAEVESNMLQKRCLESEPNIDFGDTNFKGNVLFENFDVQNNTPYTIFKEFIDNAMLIEITEQTNLYAMQTRGLEIKVDKKEIEQLIDIMLAMGITEMPDIRCYWAHETRYPPIADVMPKIRSLGDSKFGPVLEVLGIYMTSKFISRSPKIWDMV